MVVFLVKIVAMCDIYITYFIDKARSTAESKLAEACLSLFSEKRLFGGAKVGWK